MKKQIVGNIISLFHASRPENRIVMGCCPVWVLEISAERLQELEDNAEAVACGKQLQKLLPKPVNNGSSSRLRKFIKENLALIDSEVPFGWSGALAGTPLIA